MTEMLALGLGARLAASRGLVVYSDCAAALGSLRRRQRKKVKSSPYWQLDMLLDLESLVASEKVRAHPERRVIPVLTTQDKGITAADLNAGSAKFADLVITQEEVLRMLTRFAKVSLVRLSSGAVSIGNLSDARAAFDKTRYLARRDAYRLEAGRPPRWVGCNTALGAYTVGAGKSGLASQGCATRIQYDWYYWGSNRAKSRSSLAGDNLCPLCNQHEDQKHVLTCCPHPGMSVVRDRVWGTLKKFLQDVTVGDTVSALEEAQIAARADPKKEKTPATGGRSFVSEGT
jgi:hypothetical protein